jgi:hypothetical protein
MKIIMILIFLLMSCKRNDLQIEKIETTCINGFIMELNDSTKLEGTLVDCDDLNK